VKPTLILTALLATLVSSTSFAGYGRQDCSGQGIRVLLNDAEDLLTVATASGRASYKVTDITSRTGDVDFTYLTGTRVSLTLDDQYGDFVLISGRKIAVRCAGR
jgi:hypothetical protein